MGIKIYRRTMVLGAAFLLSIVSHALGAGLEPDVNAPVSRLVEEVNYIAKSWVKDGYRVEFSISGEGKMSDAIFSFRFKFYFKDKLVHEELIAEYSQDKFLEYLNLKNPSIWESIKSTILVGEIRSLWTIISLRKDEWASSRFLEISALVTHELESLGIFPQDPSDWGSTRWLEDHLVMRLFNFRNLARSVSHHFEIPLYVHSIRLLAHESRKATMSVRMGSGGIRFAHPIHIELAASPGPGWGDNEEYRFAKALMLRILFRPELAVKMGIKSNSNLYNISLSASNEVEEFFFAKDPTSLKCRPSLFKE